MRFTLLTVFSLAVCGIQAAAVTNTGRDEVHAMTAGVRDFTKLAYDPV